MNTKRIILAACCLLLTTLAARADDVFRMKKAAGAHVETLKVERRFGKSEAFSPFLSKGAITALSITGSFEKTGDEYLVRVLLKDADGKEHLVMESYEEICDKEQFAFAGYCEETALLEGIRPDSIKVYVRDAVLRIESIDIQTVAPGRMLKGGAFKAAKAEARRAQVEAVAKKINEYNVSHGKLWRAGVTDISLKDYGTRRLLVGMPDNMSSGGYEYYAGGVFEVGKHQDLISSYASGSYTNHFTWKNRHGIDWITKVQSQGNSNCCVAFAGVSCLEALVNLYYNEKVDLDLSERDLACNGGANSPYSHGVSPLIALDYLRDTGICLEDVYKFEDLPSQGCTGHAPSMLVGITNYCEIEHNENSIKNALVKYGPLASGKLLNFLPDTTYADTLFSGGHAMAIIGYHVIQGGESFEVLGDYPFVIPHNSMHIGETYWIFKNSSTSNEYQFVLFHDYSLMAKVYRLIAPIIMKDAYGNSISRTIICEDRDGDGYYNWGIGDKPSTAADWISTDSDVDDSNYLIGPKGSVWGEGINLSDLQNSTVTISGNEIYDSRRYLYRNIVIPSGSKLTIQNTRVDLYGNVNITVQDNGELVIDGGTLRNAKVELQNGSKLRILNNGTIYVRQNNVLETPLGATVDMTSGSILSESNYPN